MAAGLGFKDFTTGEVLTAADVDGYLMQGVWVFASAAARDAAVTSPQEGNFAYLKDTNVTTYYTGSAWANLDTTGMTNPMTTTGDTIYSSSGSTPARLGIGSTGQVLTVAGGVPTWAAPAAGGGMTLINSGNTSLAGAQTLTISSISGSYKHLYIVGLGIRTTNSYGANLWMRINGDTGSNYKTSRYQVVNNTIGGEGTVSPANAWFLVEINNGTAYNAVSFFQTNIPLYSNTVQFKNATTFSGVTAGGDIIQSQMNHAFNSTSAITSLEFFSSNSSTGNFLGDSNVYVYGVN